MASTTICTTTAARTCSVPAVPAMATPTQRPTRCRLTAVFICGFPRTTTAPPSTASASARSMPRRRLKRNPTTAPVQPPWWVSAPPPVRVRRSCLVTSPAMTAPAITGALATSRAVRKSMSLSTVPRTAASPTACCACSTPAATWWRCRRLAACMWPTPSPVAPKASTTCASPRMPATATCTASTSSTCR